MGDHSSPPRCRSARLQRGALLAVAGFVFYLGLSSWRIQGMAQVRSAEGPQRATRTEQDGFVGSGRCAPCWFWRIYRRCSGGTAGNVQIPRNHLARFLLLSGRFPLIGLGPFPGSARTTAPGRTQNQRRPGALLVGGAQTGSGEGNCGHPSAEALSAQRIVKPANEQRKRHLEPSARLARAGQIASPPQFGPYPLLQTARILERSNLDMSAYNRATQGIYPTISWYERSMSKKMLDMH